MEKIISYSDLPDGDGQKIHLRMETDPTLYLELFKKGYRIINTINEADESTIYVTGKRQVRGCFNTEEYLAKFDEKFLSALKERNVTIPITRKFSYKDLINGDYKLPFVFKNEKAHGGTEKFLISTAQDYKQLIRAINDMILFKRRESKLFTEEDYSIQEFIETPTKYCTSVRLLTSSSNDLLCVVLKYNLPTKAEGKGNTSLLEILLREVYPLSTKSIQSNTLRGGNNIIIDEEGCSRDEREILDRHNLTSEQFQNVVDASKLAHSSFKSELGILCGFDYIYDQHKDKWYLLEYHSKPMVGDYAVACGLPYIDKNDRISADGKVRATALALTLKKQR